MKIRCAKRIFVWGFNRATKSAYEQKLFLIINYTYTDIGELYSDAAENISAITWRIDGKVKRVQRDAASKTELVFGYDAFGRRILKINKPTTN